MQIAEKTVVQFHYDLSDANGPIESSREHDPVLYLHGQTGLIDGLVEAMEGHSAGETFTVTIPPEKAYGEVRENALHKVQAKRLQGAKKWKPGMIAILQTEQGEQREEDEERRPRLRKD